MSPYRSCALLASTALILGGALTPAVAFADDGIGTTSTTGPTAISHDDLVAALTAAKSPTASAANAGWVAQGSSTTPGSPATVIKIVYAGDRGLSSVSGVGTTIEAEHSGMYESVASLAGMMPVHRALAAIHKPGATWVFSPNASLDLHTPDGSSIVAAAAPDVALSDLVDPTKTTLTGSPTKTVNADGSTTYAFSVTDRSSTEAGGAATLSISSAGVLTALKVTSPSEADVSAYSYGAQSVTLPSAAQTVTLLQLSLGNVLATLPHQVKEAATEVATLAKKRAHKHAVKVAAIRSLAKHLGTSADTFLGVKVFSTKTVPGGVRITGADRYSHKRVSYSVTAAGKKAVVRKG